MSLWTGSEEKKKLYFKILEFRWYNKVLNKTFQFKSRDMPENYFIPSFIIANSFHHFSPPHKYAQIFISF